MAFKEIGKQIQQAREEKGYSQEYLAGLIGCSQSALSNYEKGKRRLYLSQLEKLIEVLEKPIEYFMEPRTDGNAEQLPVNQPNQEIVKLINEYYTLNSAERQSVFDYIEFMRWRRKREG